MKKEREDKKDSFKLVAVRKLTWYGYTFVKNVIQIY